jgi:hypothetical protein
MSSPSLKRNTALKIGVTKNTAFGFNLFTLSLVLDHILTGFIEVHAIRGGHFAKLGANNKSAFIVVRSFHDLFPSMLKSLSFK